MRTTDAVQRLRLLGQLDLGAGIEVAFRETLWSKQREIATAISQPRAKFAVPSCNASGKTWLAGRLALAFYNSFSPGTPCVQCGGPCRGSKVITTSSVWEHLRDNLWGELRTAYPKAKELGIDFPGRLFEGDLRIEDGANHFIIGQSSNSAEGMQGYHAAHKLIIGDEATSVDSKVQLAITRLLASSDSRLLLIYNPTTPDTYASQMARSPGVERIQITAYDTPAFTGEPMPEGSNLITHEFLEDLKAQGKGPGTFEWVTSIEAEDWDIGDDTLISEKWFDLRTRNGYELGRGTRQLGIDLAVYGADENIIAVRDGNQLIALKAFPAMRVDTFFQTAVTEAVMDWQPDILCWDGDGPGAGAHEFAEKAAKHGRHGMQIVPFRGGKGTSTKFLNIRSQEYWRLRQRFESGGIEVCLDDPKLRTQLTFVRYTVTDKGDIRVETKQEMRKRGGKGSPDRGDGVMYAFAFSDELSAGLVMPNESAAEREFGVLANTEDAMWDRLAKRYPGRHDTHPIFGLPDDW